MSIINRYLAVNFLKVWGMALGSFIVLYITVDFMEKIDNFLGKDIGMGTMALFFLTQLPKIIVLMCPVATLVGVLITLALMARSSEIVAFKASGVSLYRLSVPILVSAVGISTLIFIISDQIVPYTSTVANSIWDGQVRERRQEKATVSNVWSKGVLQVQHLGSYTENTGIAENITIIFLDDNMYMASRLDARRGQFRNGQLHLEEVLEKSYPPTTADEQGRAFAVRRHLKMAMSDWPAPPPGLGISNKSSDELSVSELWTSIDRLAAEGFGPVRQRVDLQFKFSFTMLSFIMVVVGLPLGFWREKGGSIPLGLGLGLGLSFLYLIISELCRSLGYSGVLPPVMAAWLPNLIYLLLGAYLFSYIRQ